MEQNNIHIICIHICLHKLSVCVREKALHAIIDHGTTHLRNEHNWVIVCDVATYNHRPFPFGTFNIHDAQQSLLVFNVVLIFPLSHKSISFSIALLFFFNRCDSSLRVPRSSFFGVCVHCTPYETVYNAIRIFPRLYEL